MGTAFVGVESTTGDELSHLEGTRSSTRTLFSVWAHTPMRVQSNDSRYASDRYSLRRAHTR